MEPISDMSIEQLTEAVHYLRRETNQLSRDVKEIKASMPDWLKNGNMYPPGLLNALGIPIVTHQVNPQNQITEDEI